MVSTSLIELWDVLFIIYRSVFRRLFPSYFPPAIEVAPISPTTAKSKRSVHFSSMREITLIPSLRCKELALYRRDVYWDRHDLISFRKDACGDVDAVSVCARLSRASAARLIYQSCSDRSIEELSNQLIADAWNSFDSISQVCTCETVALDDPLSWPPLDSPVAVACSLSDPFALSAQPTQDIKQPGAAALSKLWRCKVEVQRKKLSSLRDALADTASMIGDAGQ
jgi:hypothetical protein